MFLSPLILANIALSTGRTLCISVTLGPRTSAASLTARPTISLAYNSATILSFKPVMSLIESAILAWLQKKILYSGVSVPLVLTSVDDGDILYHLTCIGYITRWTAGKPQGCITLVQ